MMPPEPERLKATGSTDFREEFPPLPVPARSIPVPSTISDAARRALGGPPLFVRSAEPPPHDRAAWRAFVDETDRQINVLAAAAAGMFPAQIRTHSLSRTPTYEVIPENLDPRYADHAILFLHGGAYVNGSGIATAHMAHPLAGIAGLRTYAVDYRMPPDHPYPAALDDALEGYRFVLDRYAPSRIAVYGLSAGGGLAAALLLKARDLAMPLPAACVLATPEADLTESGDSFETNDTIDVRLRHRLSNSVALYVGNHDPRDPYLSPVFGDFRPGFPRTILTSGTRDLFLSNTVLLHRALRRAGCRAELHVWEAMPHAGFMGTPEDREVFEEQIRFIRECFRGT